MERWAANTLRTLGIILTAGFVLVTSLILSASAVPVPDIVALSATLNNNGIVDIPGAAGTGVFSVATINLGSSGSIQVTADTGNPGFPLGLSLCQTDPVSGQCITAVQPAVVTTIGPGETPTFAFFAAGDGNVVSFDPANRRIFVRFSEGVGGPIRGATSVAVRTVLP